MAELHRTKSLLEILGHEKLKEKLDELGIKPGAVFIAKKQFNGSASMSLFEGTQLTITEIDMKGSVSFNCPYSWTEYMRPFVEKVESGVLELVES